MTDGSHGTRNFSLVNQPDLICFEGVLKDNFLTISHQQVTTTARLAQSVERGSNKATVRGSVSMVWN